MPIIIFSICFFILCFFLFKFYLRIAEKLIKSGDYSDPAEAFRIAKQQVAELYGLTPSSPSPSPSPNDDSDSKKSKTNVDDLIDKYTK